MRGAPQFIIGKSPRPRSPNAKSAFSTIAAVEIDIHDLAFLNLSYWLYGKAHDTKNQNVKYELPSTLSTIFNGILSLRWNLPWHLQSLKKWSFERYYYELYKRMQHADGEDNRLKSLRILNEYAAQKLGEYDFKTALVFPAVDIKPRLKAECLKAYPPGTLEKVFTWFHDTALTNVDNDAAIDLIYAELSRTRGFGDMTSDQILQLLR